MPVPVLASCSELIKAKRLNSFEQVSIGWTKNKRRENIKRHISDKLPIEEGNAIKVNDHF